MNRATLALAAALVLSALSPRLAAQSWDGLRVLKTGDRIRVLDMEGTERSGRFQTLSGDSLGFESSRKVVAVERARVRQVQVRSSAHRVRNALIGAGIGLAIAVAVDQTLGKEFRNEGGESFRAITYVAPIALFGGIGAALPGYRTIYRWK